MGPVKEATIIDRKCALMNFLSIDAAFMEDVEAYSLTEYKAEGCEYLVLTDSEADAMARDYIRESLWAFRPSFIEYYCHESVGQEVIEAIQEKCESGNEAIFQLIKGRFDELIADAIMADGRGHFIPCSYNNEEVESDCGDFYIYRIN